MKIVNFISSWAASRAPILACLLSSSLLFRRRSFSALFCSPRPSLLYGPRLPLLYGRYCTAHDEGNRTSSP